MEYNYVTIQIDYKNGNRQTWDYDTAQYVDLDALKADMASDFASEIPNVQTMTIKYGKSTDYDMPKVKGKSFVNFVFGKIK